jgi:hypothetical protein
MTHLTEEHMVLHYYGETGDRRSTDAHLAECEPCRRAFDELSAVLQAMTGADVPERGESYGAEVWARIQPKLEENLSRRGSGWRARLHENLSGSGLLTLFTWPRLAAAGALATLLVAAFLAGRYYPTPAAPTAPAAPATASATPTPTAVRERILLVAVGEHLDRSQMVLAELTNRDATAPADISAEQDWARDLVASNRLYRQAATRDGNTAMAGVLDELERVLVDIANGPATASPADLEQLRDRLEAQGIVFKVRVLGSQIKKDASRPLAAAAPSPL